MQGIPTREDDVAEWIKKWRETFGDKSPQWYAIDDMLDDYREHADTGTPLNHEVRR